MKAGATVLAGLLAACGAASFQPEEWASGGPPVEARAAGDWELAQIRRAHGGTQRAAGLIEPLAFAVEVRDHRQSGILPWFSPLDTEAPSVAAVFVLDPPAAESAGGPAEGRDTVSQDSLRRYFLLPLLPFDAWASLPAGSHEGRAYRRLWARYGEDELVLWSDPATSRVRLAEFTFRSLGDGHKGVLDFGAWTDFPATDGWETRLLPAEVVIRNHRRGGPVRRLLFTPRAFDLGQ